MESRAPGSADQRASPDPLMTLKLVIAWAWVGIPAVWGVWQVFKRSLALFQ